MGSSASYVQDTLDEESRDEESRTTFQIKRLSIDEYKLLMEFLEKVHVPLFFDSNLRKVIKKLQRAKKVVSPKQ